MAPAHIYGTAQYMADRYLPILQHTMLLTHGSWKLTRGKNYVVMFVRPCDLHYITQPAESIVMSQPRLQCE